MCVTEFLGADYNDSGGIGAYVGVGDGSANVCCCCMYVYGLAHSAQLTLDRQVRLAKSRSRTGLCAVTAAKSSA